MNIKGVLFDMDGVLLDSEEFICRAAIAMFAGHGLRVQPADFVPFVGAGENRYIGGVAEKYNFPLDLERDKARTYQIYEEIVRGRLKPLDGAKEFIARCKAQGLKIAVATSADKVKMQINLREIGIPESLFHATVNGQEVERKKPSPDIFLKAAAKIGLLPENCLVVEDAINGVEAAKKAGCKCLGLTTSFSETDLAQADWTAPNLAKAPEQALRW